jgi:sugar O-acyltransferase (sialic acid O-acetyltransferase NeuD family)
MSAAPIRHEHGRLPLAVFGSGYRDLVKLIRAINEDRPTWDLLGFVDDRPEAQGKLYFDYPVLGPREWLLRKAPPGLAVFNNVCGKPRNSRAIASWLEGQGLPIASLIHPRIDTRYVEIGRGAILPEGAVLGSGTRIGDFFTGRLHVVISHDVEIRDFVFIGPGAVLGSETTIEDGVLIGAGATIIAGRTVGAGSVVGAGAVVVENVPANVTVAGVPARVVSSGGREE